LRFLVRKSFDDNRGEYCGVSDHPITAANSTDSNNETLPGKFLAPSQADAQRARLRNERIEAIKAEVADAAILRSKMIEAMRRRLEAQARQQTSSEEAISAKEEPEESAKPPAAPTAEALTSSLGNVEAAAPPVPPPPSKMAMPETPVAAVNDVDIDSIFVPEAEANQRRAVPPLKAPARGFPEVWDEAFQSAQRVESALARLQEALAKDERHSRRARKGAGKSARPRRPRPLRVATLFTASFMIGISAVIFAYDWRSPISLESQVTNLFRDFWPAETVKIASQTAPAKVKSVEKPLAAEPVQKPKKLALVKLVASDVQGRAGSDIPLDVQTSGGGDKVDLRILGVPDTVRVSTGKRASDGSWLLTSQQIKNAALRIPAEVSGKLQLTVEALDQKSGDLATPPQELVVKIAPAKTAVEPASSAITPVVHLREIPTEVASAKEVPLAEPPPNIELAAVEEAAEAPAMAIGISDPSRPLLARGDALMELGDVVAARSFYDRAFDLGNLRAARSIARTYDPVVLGSMKVQGLRGDPNKALEWYRKAEKAGEPDAAQAIAALETFLGQ
jgi:hypothetical protein